MRSKTWKFDSFFDCPGEDALAEVMLDEAHGKVENPGTKVLHNLESDEFDSEKYPCPLFRSTGPGFSNFITDAEVQEDLKMCGEFSPSITAMDRSYGRQLLYPT